MTVLIQSEVPAGSASRSRVDGCHDNSSSVPLPLSPALRKPLEQVRPPHPSEDCGVTQPLPRGGAHSPGGVGSPGTPCRFEVCSCLGGGSSGLCPLTLGTWGWGFTLSLTLGPPGTLRFRDPGSLIDGNFLHVPIEFLLNSSLYLYCLLFSALRVPERNLPCGEALPPSQPAVVFLPDRSVSHCPPPIPRGPRWNGALHQHPTAQLGRVTRNPWLARQGLLSRPPRREETITFILQTQTLWRVTGALRRTKTGQQHTARLFWAPGLCGQPGPLPGPDPREPAPREFAKVSSSLCRELRCKRSLAQGSLQSNVGGDGRWRRRTLGSERG